MKKINILVGLKGSGKTYIGKLLQDKLNIPFLRVEDICLRINAGREINNKAYISEAFEQIEAEIRKKLASSDQITIESTASASQFDNMVLSLRKDFIVKLVKIDTDPNLCLQRVKTRDLKNHIPVSDEQIIEINKVSAMRTFDFDLIIENNNKTDKELIEELNKLV
ncbi:MAG: AAA family ATPase [Bacteroidales bacterium]|jgi:shikimate kinase